MSDYADEKKCVAGVFSKGDAVHMYLEKIDCNIYYAVKNISDFSDETYKKSFFAMCDERKARVKRFRGEVQKKCTLAGEWMVRELLGKLTSSDPEKFTIVADEKGKLHLSQNLHWFFNISHSADTVAVAVSDKRVGIDIEKIRSFPSNLAKRVCLPKEMEYVFGKKPFEKDFSLDLSCDEARRFVEIWTVKEAYFKCIGTGITDFFAVDAFSEEFEKIKCETEEFIMHVVSL
ncbi:MAG: 4'-phosphopantetheinyl transferase superfamily protein [Clostridia bacterium]|nr:4'-phosphopantetheinyl transferase superfamily protein [Clostridia bacterium]